MVSECLGEYDAVNQRGVIEGKVFVSLKRENNNEYKHRGVTYLDASQHL